jgi:hypothetical protein
VSASLLHLQLYPEKGMETVIACADTVDLTPLRGLSAEALISNVFLPKVLTECPQKVPCVTVANVFAQVSAVSVRFPAVFNRGPASLQRHRTGYATKSALICVSRDMVTQSGHLASISAYVV